MQEDTSHLTIEELAEQVGIPVRTVRYYITEGLLPGPEGRGKATIYSAEHLQRLRLIRLLSNQRRPLAEIQQLLNRLSLAEVRTLLADEERRASELKSTGQPPAPQEYIAALLRNAQPATRRVHESPRVYESAPTPVAATWQRWELAPGVELHVKEGVEERQSGLIERICQTAGILFPKSRE